MTNPTPEQPRSAFDARRLATAAVAGLAGGAAIGLLLGFVFGLPGGFAGSTAGALTVVLIQQVYTRQKPRV